MLNRVRRQQPMPLMCRLRPLPHLHHPPKPFLRPQVQNMFGWLDTTVGTVVLMNGRMAIMSAGPIRMPDMSLVIGRNVIADTRGWKAIGNRRKVAATASQLTN